MKILPLVFLLTGSMLCLGAKVEDEKSPVVTADPWDQIKDYTYSKRTEFAAGAGRLLETLDAEIKQLNEKRASLPETSVKDWDFAMRELKEAQVYLRFTISSLRDATSETWAEAKEKVARAWIWVKDACRKVRSSTTA